MKTKLLLFDFDGTLFNTAEGIHKAVNMVALEKGVGEFSFDLVKKLIGYGAESLMHHLDDEARHRLGELTSLTKRYMEVYSTIAMEHSKLFPGAVNFLNTWDGELAIVSNKSKGILKEMVEQSELGQFDWKAIIGGNTYEEKKPHPMPLLKAMETTGYEPSETCLVGDGVPDAISSTAAGIPFIGVRFGYGPESQLIQNGCRFFIDNFSDLPEQIQMVDASRNGVDS